jgi:hypothetical protein
MQFHLAANGGFPAALKHLGPPFQSWWEDEARAYQEIPVDLSDQNVSDELIKQSEQWTSTLDVPRLVKSRDELLVQLIKDKAEKSLP